VSYSPATVQAFKTAYALAVPHEMSTPEWAETYRIVDRGARKGKWSNETVPFLTGIMAAADDPFVREIVFQKSSQVGGSEVINNILGKRIHLAPTEIIYCAEKEDKATAWTQESFDSMVRATPELRRLVSGRPEENNQRYKAFAGGGLYIVWATSPAELSSRPVQILFFDEKAAYKPTKEGDPVKLGEARTKTYDGEELIVKNSTPRRCECTSPGETCGDISHDFARGDQRDFYVPCPHCEEFQTLKFGGKDTAYGLKWDPDLPESPYYLCEHCSAVIEEFDREDMLSKGYWRASQPFNGVASFRINQLYSPFVSWGRLVLDFLDAKKSAAKLEVFTNTVLGETWKPVERIEYEDLAWNLETYPCEVPPGVLVLTAGVDVQKDRIECEVVGWGRDNESWSIAYEVFYGSPGIELSPGQDTDDEAGDDTEPLSSVWDDLETFLTRSFVGPDGTVFRIQCAGVDYGYLSRIVAKFCKRHERKRWFAVKGMSDPFKPAVSKPTRTGHNPKVRMFPLGTNALKDEVFASLKVIADGPGRCHFPDAQPYTEEAHMKQLASERMVTHTRGGRTYRVYEKVSASVRNEALDVRVYATAARVILNPNYEAIARRRLQHTEVTGRPEDSVDVGASVTGTPTDGDGPEPVPPPPRPPDNVRPFRRRFRTPFGGTKL
jgi:terminase, large subunit